MSKLRGYFHPAYNPHPTGFNKEGGRFFIGLGDNTDEIQNQISIELTVWAEQAPSKSTYAHIRVYHDGIKTFRQLDYVGFIDMFEEIGASTFYDVVQCCARCDIPITYHGDEYTREVTPRKIYEILYMNEDVPT